MADIVIDISDIVSEFGSYYIDNGQNTKDLRLAIMDRSETDAILQLHPTNDTQVRGGNVDMDPVLQAFQETFTPYGGATFEARKIDLFQLKIDQAYNPDKLVKSWVGFMASNSTDRTTWPFIKWLIQAYIIPKAAEDWELNGIFKGNYVAPTPGTAQPISAAVDGIKTIINDAITATTLTPITMGTVPTDPADFVKYVEDMVAQIPTKYLPWLGPLAMSATLEMRFRKGMRQLYNMNYNQVGDLLTVIDTPLQVKGLRSHEGSGKIWTTVKGNAELFVKAPANKNVFEVEKVDRKVKLYTDFWKAPNFWRYDWIFTNDVDL